MNKQKNAKGKTNKIQIVILKYFKVVIEISFSDEFHQSNLKFLKTINDKNKKGG